MVFSDEDKILIKSLHLKGFTAKRLTDEFPEKRWTKRGTHSLQAARNLIFLFSKVV